MPVKVLAPEASAAGNSATRARNPTLPVTKMPIKGAKMQSLRAFSEPSRIRNSRKLSNFPVGERLRSTRGFTRKP